MAGPKAYALNEQAARWLAKQVNSKTTNSEFEQYRQFGESAPPKVHLFNTEYIETCPAFGIVEAVDYYVSVDDLNTITVTVRKPTNVVGLNKFFVNGPSDIPPRGTGVAQSTYFKKALIVPDKFRGSLVFEQRQYVGINGWRLDEIPGGQPLADITIFRPSPYFYVPDETVIMTINPLQTIMVVPSYSSIPGRANKVEGGGYCEIVTNRTDNGELYYSTASVIVYNWTKDYVLQYGDRLGIASWINGCWKIIAQDCVDFGGTTQPLSSQSTIFPVPDAIDTSTQQPILTQTNFHETRYSSTATGSGFE